jgi:hypothetical protein
MPRTNPGPNADKKPDKVPPVQEFRIGLLKAAIWANPTDDGVRYNVTFLRSYKDGEAWKTSNAFGRDDLLAVAKLADMAHSWIVLQRPRRTSGRTADSADLRKGKLPSAA